MTIIEQGVRDNLISFDSEKNFITYTKQKKRRSYKNPEELIQAETYLTLIYDYNYSPDQIEIYVSVKMGVSTKEADIVVYKDEKKKTPYILVECKKEEVSEPEFLQAIEQAYSYCYAIAGEIKYVWVTSGIRNEFFEVDINSNTRVTHRDIPRKGVIELLNYRYVYDADSIKQDGSKQALYNLETIEESELTKIFKQAHDALWGGGQLNPSEAFDELDKLIFCKVWDERKDRKPGEPYDFQVITISSKEEKDEAKRRKIENDRLYKRVLSLYEEGRKKDPEVFRDNIRLTPEKIRTVVGYLEKVNLGETDLDAKGRAFETFMHSYFKGNFGQYFTPRPIVNFITKVLPITNESKVLDTSCGSGGFLLYALNKVRKQADKLYPDYKTDTRKFDRHKKYWHDFAEKRLFGIEINEQISRAAKMNMIIHDDGHTNVITSDGLLSDKEIQKNGNDNKGFEYNSFDFIITNPPFGSVVRQTEKAYLREYKLGKKESDWLAVVQKPETNRDSQSTEVLFIEQCHRFLKPDGYLAIVIPDGILTNSSMQYVRDKIENMFRILAVVSLPQTAFMANGAGVKSSVLFLRKNPAKVEESIISKKEKIRQNILKSNNYIKTIENWDKETNEAIKELEKKAKEENPDLDKNQITELIKDAKNELQEKNAIRKSELQDLLIDEADEKIKEEIESQGRAANYPIFMAIAEEIGYDAAGKEIKTNELDKIAPELEQFINEVNDGKF